MKILCKLFGHSMYYDFCSVAAPSTCKRCGHKEPGIKWDRNPSPMPKVSPPKKEICDSCKNA